MSQCNALGAIIPRSFPHQAANLPKIYTVAKKPDRCTRKACQPTHYAKTRLDRQAVTLHQPAPGVSYYFASLHHPVPVFFPPDKKKPPCRLLLPSIHPISIFGPPYVTGAAVNALPFTRPPTKLNGNPSSSQATKSRPIS